MLNLALQVTIIYRSFQASCVFKSILD